MPEITKYAVSIEDDSSGAVDWYNSRAIASAAYETALDEFDATQEINLFEFAVDEKASRDQITNKADATMWQRDYIPIRWRAGTGHSAKPHNNPPTDA